MVSLPDPFTTANLQSGALALATVLSLVLLIVSALSYRRSREGRILLVSGAFGLFFLKNLVLSILVFRGELGNLLLYSAAFDSLLLLSFYLALFRRR